MDVVVTGTAGLSPARTGQLRRLWDLAFDDFSDADAAHAAGGVHVLAVEDDEVLAHASAVPRLLTVGQDAYPAGYVEAVATVPAHQGTGLGTLVVSTLQAEIRRRWDLGALSTGRHGFYERLGWERWQGPTYVRTSVGLVRSEEDDDGLMVLRFGRSEHLDLAAPIVCEDRPGDAW